MARGQIARAAGDLPEALMAFQLASAHLDRPEYAERVDDQIRQTLEQMRPRWDLPEALDGPLDVERTVDALQEFIARDTRLVDFMAPTQKIARQMNAPLSIAIVGEFNAGKSTLINALVGEEIVPMGVLPTTAHTGIIQYGPRQAARIIWRDGRVEEVDFAQAKRAMKQNSDAIDYLEYLNPHPELRAVHFLGHARL